MERVFILCFGFSYKSFYRKSSRSGSESGKICLIPAGFLELSNSR